MLPVVLLAAAAAAPVRFHYDASEWANATCHLACLESRITCSDSVYERYWTTHGSAADAKYTKAFAQAMDRIEAAQPQPQAAPLLPNYGRFHPSIRKRAEVVAAAVNAGSEEICRRNLSRIVPASDAQVIATAIERVRRSLRPWWVRQGRPAAASFGRNVNAAVSGAGMEELASRVAAFLSAELKERDVWLHIVPSPAPEGRQSSGTFAGNHFFMEITKETKPRDAAWVTLHELTHALYDAVPPAGQRRLIEQFTAFPDGQPFYALLNEMEALQRVAGGTAGYGWRTGAR
jgi:hypothetical protein